MSKEFVKLDCSSCGGQLEIDPEQSIIVCPYCGHRYVIQEIVNELVRCPVCDKNDGVTKVDSIPKEHRLYDVLSFDLDDLPVPDDVDDPGADDGHNVQWAWVLIIIPILVVRLFFRLMRESQAGSPISTLLFIVAGVILGTAVIRSLNRATAEKHQKAHYRQLIRDLNIKQYDRITPLYERLYYCERDGVVFLPGKGDFAAAEQMLSYMQNHL
jgi:DNA-directed RNA polymerase subunit RPC12/RpoP